MKKRNIYLSMAEAYKNGFIITREDWFNKYQDESKKTYLNIVKGAPLLINVEGSCITLDNVYKLVKSYFDRAIIQQWEEGERNIDFKWKR